MAGDTLTRRLFHRYRPLPVALDHRGTVRNSAKPSGAFNVRVFHTLFFGAAGVCTGRLPDRLGGFSSPEQERLIDPRSARDLIASRPRWLDATASGSDSTSDPPVIFRTSFEGNRPGWGWKFVSIAQEAKLCGLDICSPSVIRSSTHPRG